MKKGILLVITLYELLIVSNFVVNGRPSENDALNKFMLQKHNELRSNLTKCNVRGQPPPVEMPMLRYDQELADLAQQWVDQCKDGHWIPATSSWGDNVGQNWAGGPNFQVAFDLWFAEYKLYNYDRNSCSGTCGHYTQMVWSSTRAIGCAIRNCAGVQNFPYGNSITCNYGPAGNLLGRKPYEKADKEQCSSALKLDNHTSWIWLMFFICWSTTRFSLI
ncbi:Peptidase inhibitor 16 [Fasciola hepatica]|uniref:Peptidase inhibitor 16 n=1 Tax=Fasciola hepatica TaxID=6192 RepID=A0A2H1CCQ3_FASHE|nr:Peptidase inhibitor 16 [Fasciola hepatica]